MKNSTQNDNALEIDASRQQMLHKLLIDLIGSMATQHDELGEMVDFFVNPEVVTLFEHSFELPYDEVQRSYEKLAHDSYKEGVPYSLYSEQISFFAKELLNQAVGMPDDIAIVHAINSMRELVINASAKAYLFELLNDDIPMITNQLNEYVAIDYINAHLHWMKRLIFDIEKKQLHATVELDPQRCQFGMWLATGEIANYFSSKEVASIHKVHRMIHNSGKSLYGHLKEQKFHEVLLDYLFLSRTSISLVSRLNTKITHQVLSAQVETDVLTQVKNRSTLEVTLSNHLRSYKTEGLVFSIAMIDIDFFKSINDRFGHQSGDEVLIKIAKILKKSLRSSDMIYRYGGEEFLVLFPDTDLEKVVHIAEKLRQNIENTPFSMLEKGEKLTVSIGVAAANEEIETVAQLIKKADERLYAAKHQGRNKVVWQ